MARYSAQQLADLRAAIAEGVTRVTSNGRMIEYRSLSDMEQLERKMSAELEGETYKPGRIYCGFRRA